MMAKSEQVVDAVEPPTVAYVALGANLGDRSGNLRVAVRRLGEVLGVRVERVSSFLETEAVGGPQGSPAYLNGVAEVRTALAPRELLGALLNIESAMGRVRRERWGPRVIDLDLVLYGNLVIAEEGLCVPHPRLHEREFVLAPLAEVAPAVAHPVLKRTVSELLAELRARSK